MSINRIIFQQIIVYSYYNTLLQNKKEWATDIPSHKDKFQKTLCWAKESYTKEYLCPLFHVNNLW